MTSKNIKCRIIQNGSHIKWQVDGVSDSNESTFRCKDAAEADALFEKVRLELSKVMEILFEITPPKIKYYPDAQTGEEGLYE